ncbi:hypothetical protein NEUTE1DRAFT_122829 [Neurospora tetrasperma FGSC 2508]|uniref:Uncharacterized protein n=1 Tax=Neurospora tetrasperma (strain FGSC 2508 / ATCC MYA-4615 / P0657) TaxID=510951 RepID=F8MP98_NEUT8|nr:uncharacterized protein NEUTE1DRAFT_122829 [Neurospora tetrasperma FGSC 2508]EGO56263.1 hypothetical protein NEUTE1DRAFT_122829 [Neurospora tetrasperma FGSC 2508]
MIRQPFRRLPVSRCLTLGRVGCAPVCISEIFFLVNGYTASVVVRTRPPRTPFALRESINLWQPYAVTRSASRMRALAGAVVGSKEHEQALVCAARHPEVSKRTGQPWTYDSRFLLHCLVGETSDIATFTRVGGGEKTWKRSHLNHRREKPSYLVQPTTRHTHPHTGPL